VASSPSPAPAGVARAGSLGAHRFHTVAPGDCLWSIAEGILPEGAGDAEIAAEVARLWRLNAALIGTGDPSLIRVGTVLRLR
jgi:nucleoid-associated protein YgaU